MLRKGRAADEPVDAVASVVSVQRNDPVETLFRELFLEELDFRLGGLFPEFPVQIAVTARFPRAIDIAARIAQRVDAHLIVAAEPRLRFEDAEEVDARENARNLIAVNPRE